MGALCQCGCGADAPIAPHTNTARGWVSGEPLRYVHGHNRRVDRSLPRACNRCGDICEPEEFYNNRPECRICTRSAQKGRVQLSRVGAPYTEAHREYHRAVYRAKYELRRAQIDQWRADNPERIRELGRASTARRRARELEQFVEDVQAATLILRDEGRCGICGDDLEGPDFHVDHIIPLSRGGEHSYANTQLAHAVCNMRKGASL